MSPDNGSTVTKDKIPKAATAEDQRLVIDGLDIRKLDRCLENLNNRLGGGGFGDWFVEGSRLSIDHRKQALEEVIELKKIIERLNETLTRQGRAPGLLEREIRNNAKTSGAMNSKTRETTRSMIAQELDAKMRDVGIKMERMEQEVKDLKRQLATANESNKKGAKRAVADCDGDAAAFQAQDRKMKSLGSDVKAQGKRLADVEASVKTIGAKVEKKNFEHSAEMLGMDDGMSKLTIQVEELKTALVGSRRQASADMGRLDRKIKEAEDRIETLEDEVFDGSSEEDVDEEDETDGDDFERSDEEEHDDEDGMEYGECCAWCQKLYCHSSCQGFRFRRTG